MAITVGRSGTPQPKATIAISVIKDAYLLFRSTIVPLSSCKRTSWLSGMTVLLCVSLSWSSATTWWLAFLKSSHEFELWRTSVPL